MEKNIFSNTLLDEVMNFKGEILPIPERKETLPGEKEVGDMTDLEKVLNTMNMLKVKEGQKIFSDITGVAANDLKEEDQERYFSLLVEKATPENIKQMDKVREEAEFYQTLMWKLIRVRTGLTDRSVKLHLGSGFKIFSSPSIMDSIENFFSGFGGGIGIHMIKVGRH